MRTKLFFDTEFTGLRQDTSLISIGIISECGKTFYAELTDYHRWQLDEWINMNVISNLRFSAPLEGEDEYYIMSKHFDNSIGNDIKDSYSLELRCDSLKLKEELSQWLSQFKEVELWSDCLAYDWVLFCDIFGDGFDLPKNAFYIPFDISTLLLVKGIDPDINRETYAFGTFLKEMKDQKHNALWDATVIKACYLKAIDN